MANNNFMRGYAVVIAHLIRVYDLPSMAKDIMDSDGITIADLKKAKIDDFDLLEIMKLKADDGEIR